VNRTYRLSGIPINSEIIFNDKNKKAVDGFNAIACCLSVKAQALYVGANYHPHDDKNEKKKTYTLK